MCISQALRSIANQIAAAIPAYRTALRAVPVSDREDRNPLALFNTILKEPLSNIESGQRMVVVLDALDECATKHLSVLLNIIANKWGPELPSWLGLVAATRPESRFPAASFQPEVLVACD